MSYYRTGIFGSGSDVSDTWHGVATAQSPPVHHRHESRPGHQSVTGKGALSLHKKGLMMVHSVESCIVITCVLIARPVPVIAPDSNMTN